MTDVNEDYGTSRAVCLATGLDGRAEPQMQVEQDPADAGGCGGSAEHLGDEGGCTSAASSRGPE